MLKIGDFSKLSRISIRMLRHYDEIGLLHLEKYEDSKEMENFLMMKRQEIAEEENSLHQKLRLIDSTIEWIRKDGNIMGYDVSLKTLPERYVASVRQVIPSYDREGILWKILMEETAHMQMQDGAPCYTLAIYHDGEYKESDVDVEVQKSVLGSYSDTEHVKFKTIPPVQIASATFTGGYEQITRVSGKAVVGNSPRFLHTTAFFFSFTSFTNISAII